MAVTQYNSGAAFLNSDVVCAGPAILNSVMGFNSLTTAQFICIFDSNTVPANGTVPRVSLLAAPNQTFHIEFVTTRIFDFGISWANSSTMPTLTIGLANIWLTIAYGPKSIQ